MDVIILDSNQQPVTKSLISFNRSPTWISPEFASEVAASSRHERFSEEQKDFWEQNPNKLLEYRKKIEATMNEFFDLQYKEQMKRRLTKNGLAEKLIPSFALGCRR